MFKISYMTAVEIRTVFHYFLSLWNIIFVPTTLMWFQSLQIFSMFEMKYLHYIHILKSIFCVHLLFYNGKNHEVIDNCVGNLGNL